MNNRVETKRNKLHIHKASPEDNGVYTCLARSEAGSSPMVGNFALVIPGNETATINVVPRNVIAKRGEAAVFHCAFQEADAVQWYFKEVGPLETDDEKTIFENGTLHIVAAEHKDQGVYSCHGIRGDTVQVYTAELQIACESELCTKFL